MVFVNFSQHVQHVQVQLMREGQLIERRKRVESLPTVN